jgi:hypothetical protein
MINTERKELRMEDLQEWVAIFLIFSSKESKITNQRK